MIKIEMIDTEQKLFFDDFQELDEFITMSNLDHLDYNYICPKCDEIVCHNNPDTMDYLICPIKACDWKEEKKS